MAAQPQNPAIFISYSTQNTSIADAICRTLEAAGYSCWIAPRNIPPGQSWTEAIIDGINGARMMVLALSAASNDSPQVLREVERAVSKRIPVLVLRIENVALSKSLEYLLSIEQWLDAFTEPVEPHLQRLVQVVQQLMTSPAERGALPPISPHAEASTPISAPGPSHNLPRQLTSFIGREKEVEEIERLLQETCLLTLTGAGGCGKTRLAYKVAADTLDSYPDGVWAVELAPLSDPSLVPQAVATVFGVREEPGRALMQTLVDHLKQKRLLLILDNCEHLISACAALADTLLRDCLNLRLLATSRVSLDITGEIHYRISPLPTPDTEHLSEVESLKQNEAVRLFLERALTILPSFTVSSSAVYSVANICHRLDGIPLAIELAAARVNAMPIEQLASRLDDRFRLLTKGRRTDLPHHQTLRALIDWSYDLLSEQERMLIRRLAVFAGGCTLPAAEAICSEDGIEEACVLDLISALVDKSLVVYQEQDGEGRYHLLETVRQYSRERLLEAEKEQAETVQGRHYDFFLRLMEEAEPELLSVRQTLYLDRLEAEHDNFRSALEWCREQGKTEGGLRLAGALSLFWFFRSYLSEGWDYLTGFLAQDAPTPPSVRLKALTGAGILAYFRGDLPRASALCEEVLSLPYGPQDTWPVCIALSILGTLSYYQGGYEQAVTLFERSLTLAQQAKDAWLIALALSTQGLVALYQGDLGRANQLCEESLALARSTGEKWCTFNSLYSLGLVTMAQADYARARALFEEALSLSRDLGHFVSIAVCLEGLAGVCAGEGHGKRAVSIFGAAAARRELLGVSVPPAFRAHYDQNIAALREALGEADFAAVWAEGRAMSGEQAIDYALHGEEKSDSS